MKVASASAPLYSFQGLNLAYEGKPTVQGYEQAADIQISDDGRMVSDWARHFMGCFSLGYSGNALDANLKDRMSVGMDGVENGQHRASNGDLFEYAAGMYDKMKSEIDFSDSSEKKKLYMIALDSAFEVYIQSQMAEYADRMADEKKMDENRARKALAEGRIAPLKHPIASNKGFNADKFNENLLDMAKQFVRAFIAGSQNGGYKGGWDNVAKILGQQETTSVNELSFNDFNIITKGLSRNNAEITPGGIDTYYSGKYFELSVDDNLSEYMRNVFTGAFK